MTFTSYGYLYFLLLAVLLRWSAPRGAVPAVVLGTGLFFLWTFGWLAVVVLLVSAGATYVAGLAMERFPGRRRLILAVLVTLLVGSLAFFKYADFLLRQIVLLGGAPERQNLLPLPGILAPVAISYFTFQMIAYGVDACRGTHPVERSAVRFFGYLVFFPNVVSGPIVRPGDVLPQIASPRRFDPEGFSFAVFLFIGGAFKKLVLADALGPGVARVFDDPAAAGTISAWVASLAYTAQIYCDFSGYTDMARGSAGMLGIDLPVNFHLPYLSESIADFWRRWHMSLSYWLRDYLYIPLGGSRRGRLRTYRNLMLTMLLAGLWHGSSWTMIVWGGLHGALLAVHRAWRDLVGGVAGITRVRDSGPYRVLGAFLTLACVNVAWVFFRAPTIGAAWKVIRRMFAGVGGWDLLEELRSAPIVLAAVAVGHALCAGRSVELAYRGASPAVRGLIWAALIVACFWFAAAPGPFIYVRF